MIMNGKQLNILLNLEARHALYREDGCWYHHLTDFPGVLFDKDGYLIVNSQEDYLNNKSLQHRQDLHIVGGISLISGYMKFSREDRKKIFLNINEFANEETLRKMREIDLIVRNNSLVRILKDIYRNTCQICETSLQIAENKYYSEVHHIKPLGSPHNGPDKLDNMICICPNCHVLLDLGVIELNLKILKNTKHIIDNEYIVYHNEVIKGIRIP
jgi:5-methylcytosine-specific restriction enzyme A